MTTPHSIRIRVSMADDDKLLIGRVAAAIDKIEFGQADHLVDALKDFLAPGDGTPLFVDFDVKHGATSTDDTVIFAKPSERLKRLVAALRAADRKGA